MKKENIKVGNIYTLNGNMVQITAIHPNGDIYAGTPIIKDDYVTGIEPGTKNLLTEHEIKHLTY